MRRFGRLGLIPTSLGAALAVAACGDDPKPVTDTSSDTGSADTVLVPDTNEDDTTAADTLDVGDTTQADTAADTGTDATSEVDTNSPTGELAIAKGDRCDSLVPVEGPALPYSDNGDTSLLSDDYIYTTGTACGGTGETFWGDASPDAVYSFTPAISGTYVIQVTPTGSHDPAVMVSESCPPIGEDDFRTLGCLGVADQVTEGKAETLRVDLVGGRTAYILIDGWNNDLPVAGGYALSVSLGEDCSDDRDNNGDGAVDCADSQCTNEDACDEATYASGCGNGEDDDGDGKEDCADSDCAGVAACDEATYANGCANDKDDDGDGVSDCADEDCADVTACDESTYPNGCGNSTDDDGDGETDCADVNCSGIGACNESLFADGCTNGVDDEGDSRTDCADPDCGANPNCLGPAETCEEAVVITLGETISGTTTGRTNDYSTSSADCTMASSATTSYGAATADAAYRFTAPSAGLYDFQAIGDFDNALTVTSSCDFSSGVCYGAEVGVASSGERIVIEMTANQTVFVIVDGWSNSSETNTGDFTLSVKRAVATEVETNCEDRVDQDGDGDIDCADADCAFDFAACTETGKCGDNVDNDDDGSTDCDDSECRADAIACPTPPGDACGTPAVVTVSTPATFDTCDFAPDFDLSSGECAEGSSGAPDGVVSFTAPAAGAYYFELDNGGNFDSAISVVSASSCPTGAFVCDAADDAFGAVDAVSLSLAANETVWIIATGFGDLDWGDPDCGAVTVRVSVIDSEVCTDGIDNDRDDSVDCDDSDCAEDLACNESLHGAAACTDSADNDEDGFIDCFDIDCAGSSGCPLGVPGDSCATAIPVTGESVEQTFDTCAYTNDFTATETANCQSTTSTNHTAQDFVVQFTAPSAGEYIAKFDTLVDGSSFDAVMNVVKATTCPTSPVASCVDGSDEGSVESVRFVATAPGELFWLVVDGYSTACSKGKLTIRKLGPEVCDDGVDNNENGDIDCEDAGCDVVPSCNESLNGPQACSNGLDEDDDALVDCFDADCATLCPNGPPGDNCAEALEVTEANFSAGIDTCAYANDFNVASGNAGQCRGSTFGPTAPDVIVKFVAPEAGDYRIAFDTNLDGSSFDAVLNVIKATTCPSSPISGCVIGSDSGAIESGRITAAAGDVFWVIADGYSSGCSLGRLSITKLAPEVCTDGFDNDGDNTTDCDDSECRASEPILCPSPAGENCANPSVLSLGTPTNVDTCEFGNDFASTSTGGCTATAGAPDMAFSFTAATAGTYRFQVNADWIDVETAVNLVRGATCPASPLTTCAASGESSSGTPNQQKDVPLTTGETVWLILGSNYNATECGDVAVTVTRL
jgi:hypothetical protein